MTLLASETAIETPRLVLRRIGWDDLDWFAEAHADAEVARYIGHGKPRTRQETEGWLAAILESYDRASLGQLAVLRKDSGTLVGRCGLSDAAVALDCAPGAIRQGWFFTAHVPPGTAVQPLPELGYTFARESWGQGYASEAAGAVWEYARAKLPFRAIMSVIHPENRASLAVASKYGVHYLDQLELSGRVFDRYHWPLEENAA